MRTALSRLNIPVYERDLVVWLWAEARRLNISREELVQAILIDAMLDAREKPSSPVHEVTI